MVLNQLHGRDQRVSTRCADLATFLETKGFLETKATTVRLTPAQQEAETERLMAQADTDGDGVLTFEEFEAWFTPTCREIQQLSRGKDVMRKQRNAQKRR